MKKFLIIIFAAVLVLFAAGCNKNKGASVGIWEEVHGSFVREDSGQYNNAVLSMMYLSNGCVMFEFKLMEGNEAEHMAYDTFIPGVLLADKNGRGFYETIPDAVNPFTIDFKLSEDGQKVTVTHTGDLVISPDGEYIFIESGLEVSPSSANAIIEHLPTAATSLNSNLGAYTVNYPDSLIADWFYLVEATFDDTGAVLAKFLIAKDLSAVFRADDDIEPILIFGSAQPMMDAEIYVFTEYEEIGEPDENEEIAETLLDLFPVVSVETENGVSMAVGASEKLIAFLPWELSYTITAKSSNDNIVAVNTNGVITAVAEGEAVISGIIEIEDGAKEFTIEISVTNELENITVLY
jgi:hypothetical protein